MCALNLGIDTVLIGTISVLGDADRARAVQVHVYSKRRLGCLKIKGVLVCRLVPSPL